MATNSGDGGQSGTQCPTCGETFASEQGMKSHHTKVHGVSIAGHGLACEECGGAFTVPPRRIDSAKYCSIECKGTAERNDTTKHECPTCGDHFKSRSGVGTHHSQMHGSKIGQVELTCETCGEGYTRHESVADDSRYCSHECQTEGQRDRVTVECIKCGTPLSRIPAEAQGENWCSECFGRQYEEIETECGVCGEQLMRKRRHVESFEVSVCDASCRASWLWEQEKIDTTKFTGRSSDSLSGEGNPNWGGGPTQMACTNCGEGVERLPYRAEPPVFCSHDCHSEWLIETEARAGENHPNWAGGTFPYGPGFNEAKKEAVRERDDRECQGCGMPEADHIERFGQKLSVHHKQKARQFEDPRKRNCMSNLVSLCQSGCHQLADRMAPLYPFAE